jgi:hypothetical protein
MGAFLSLRKYPLNVSQYDRGNDISGLPKPRHWSLTIVQDSRSQTGLVYQLKGGAPWFRYDGREPSKVLEDQPYIGSVRIGEVKRRKLDEFEDVLKKVAILNREPRQTWNCQNWILGALPALKERGFVWDYVNAEWIRNNLGEVDVERESDEINERQRQFIYGTQNVT